MRPKKLMKYANEQKTNLCGRVGVDVDVDAGVLRGGGGGGGVEREHFVGQRLVELLARWRENVEGHHWHRIW